MCGFAAGCINTLSGNGSILTLGFMTEVLGMPAMANGTNRLGLFTQGVAAQQTRRNERLELYDSQGYILSGIVGALAGALTSVFLDAGSFRQVYKMLMLGMLVLALLRPERWIRANLDSGNCPIYHCLLCLSFLPRAPFRSGMNFFLFIMVNILKTPIGQANIIKLIMSDLYTFLIIIIFHHYHMMDWRTGMIIALGQGAGGWMMARWASRVHNVEKWGYVLFVSAIALTVMKLFGWLAF
ncbi:MAG: sulfite exporter TauE/SafE family protein [Saprospiraceae bacterium]